MKEIIDQINKIFENRYRLAIMSLLMVHESMDFNGIKKLLDLTDGNLASHLSTLEKEYYISVKKDLKNNRSITYYMATERGKKSFSDHLDALEKIIKNT